MLRPEIASSATSDLQLLFEWKMRILDPKARKGLKGLMQAQDLSPEYLYSLNWERRRALVDHCATKIPFYQRAFRNIGFEPGDLQSEEDWAKLPVLEKNDIRVNANELVDPAFNLTSLPAATTGGTTGLPLKTYNDPSVHLASMSWRMLSWWGLHPADNSGYLYRAIPNGISKLLRDIALMPTRRSYIAASDMTEKQMETFLAELQTSAPRYLVGYVGALEVFAKFCEKRGVNFPNLTALWTTASPLNQHLRNYLEAVFKAPAYTQYGSCEFYWIAAECSHRDGMHIGNDIRHVDVMESEEVSAAGGFGDLLVTDLINRAFPLLRYRLGDRGRLLNRSCSCGLPFPMMDYVRGRISDTLEFADGTSVPGEFWTTIFDDFTDDVSAFQVIQRADRSVHINYTPNPKGDGARAASTVLARLYKQTHGKADIQMHEVAEIPHRDGKVQIVVREYT